jgi:CubicO group peptidase (beta-lactamase class C family)
MVQGLANARDRLPNPFRRTTLRAATEGEGRWRDHVSGNEMLSKAEALFRRQHERGAFPGGQLVVRAQGEELLNVSVGIARGLRPGEGERVPVTDTTPFQVMSASKPVVAFSIAVLEDRGLLDVERRVSRYVPEFGREGKEDVTVLDVLTHRSGILVPRLWDSPETWCDWDRVQEEIWNSRPRYRRGTLAYHPWEFGWILGEVVRRVTKRSLPEFLDELLPEELRSLRLRVDHDTTARVARTYWLGPERYRLAGQDVAARFEEKNNAPSTLTSLVPGASMITTASTLAKFYEMILAGGTTAEGTRLIRPDTLERYLRPNVAGVDRASRSYTVLGRGFLPGWLGPHPYGWWNTRECVGHPGGFCVVAFGDRRTGAAIAAVTNGNRGFGDVLRSFAPLSSSIRSSLRRLRARGPSDKTRPEAQRSTARPPGAD